MAKKSRELKQPDKAKADAQRGDELWGTSDDLDEDVLKYYTDVEKGFDDQNERTDDTLDYWDIYNCKLTGKQFYAGNSQIFVPICQSAVEARVTRFGNQLFPQSGRYVEAIAENGVYPQATMALLDHYVRKAKLKTQVVPALLRNADVEGQMSLYVSWVENKRHVTYKSHKPHTVPLDDEGEVEAELPEDTYGEMTEIKEEVITHAYPKVEVLADTDLLVLPATSDSLEEAIANGGSVTVLRRWTKARIKKAIKDEEIDKAAGEALLDEMDAITKGPQGTVQPRKDKAKEMADAAGIKAGGKYAVIYETWKALEIEDEWRLCRIYYGGPDKVLSIKVNPYWSDKLPILSVPVDKVQGSFKGKSQIAPVADLQYQANDAVNEAMDSAAYALMPIIMTDPEKNPRTGTMILSLAAVWETSPKDTQFAQFPPLWKDGMEIVATCKNEIFQALSVNPSMITQASGKTKKNAAEIAKEQDVDLLTTAIAVSGIEEGILTPLLQRFLELDHQYRSDDLILAQHGEVGQRAVMERIPPHQWDRAITFRWFGVEAARSAQQMQQQIAAVNVIRGIPPQQYPDYDLDLQPVLVMMIENTFGPRLAPLMFKKKSDQMPVPPEQENLLLSQGFELQVHPMDNDQEHLKAHMTLLQSGAFTGGTKKIQAHMLQHVQQMQKKIAQMQVGQQGPQQGSPGVPGGAGPGVAGTPRIGAQPGQPRMQQPPGAVPQDQMPGTMPRAPG